MGHLSPTSLTTAALAVGSFLLAACSAPQVEFPSQVKAQLPEVIDFNYHVKPILSDRCFACHGPDAANQEAGLRLDLAEHAYAALQEHPDKVALTPGDPHESELYHRIVSDDPEVMMPPPESNLSLSEVEVATLTRWIEQGAAYQPHWSFIPPEQPAVPPVDSATWARNLIDRFVLHRLEREGFTPAPAAERVTLLRRLTFDLTGLPPTPEEVDAFVADRREDAYERVVDRLLASPHYGERMATDWLDVARYADSHGYHADGYRRMWPWRDWVIRAFNENMPFDQFATWQMAGDLLPDATQEQRLATGFHRNHPASSEGGIVPEEYRMENVFDRTNTTAKAFLGLTLECARCHDHRYDPVSQKEYYRFFAFFNNVDELGMIPNDGNTAPTMLLMEDEAVAKQVEYLRHLVAEQEEAQAQYVQQVLAQPSEPSEVAADFLEQGLVGYYPLDELKHKKTTNLVGGPPAFAQGEVAVVPGQQGAALHFDREYESLFLDGIGDFERTDPFSMGAWVRPDTVKDYAVVMSNAGDKNAHWRGYELFLDSANRAGVRLIHELPDACLYVTTRDRVPVDDWSHLMMTYDGSSRADGITVYLNGRAVPTDTHYDHLESSIRAIDDTLHREPRPVRVGRSGRFTLDIGLFEGAIDEVRMYDRRLTGLEVAGVTGDRFWENTREGALSPAEQALLAEYYLAHRDPRYRALSQELQARREREHAVVDTLPSIMVMREMDTPRPTYVLDRGLYDAPTEEVQPGTPAQVGALPDDLPPNRLGLARWLTSEENPLTARVIVNRYWHQFFGRGIVGSLEDFGNQGDLPSHPELLDWLAVEFVDSGWDVKALLRLIVTSATYRQSSVADPALRERDPNNQLLGRGPSYRWPAEMIRDNALAASGLLVNKIGGPSVRTYQPEGLWSNTHYSRLLIDYEPDRGEKLYRRSMYTFVRRTAPPPTMTVLDASNRSMCIVRRQRTSTPLQSLLMLNEPQLVEAARLIAERALREGGAQPATQLDYAFRLLTSRPLTEAERTLLTQLYDEEYEKYQRDEDGAAALLAVGDYPRDASLPLPKVAALAVVTNVIMNYDEVYTKR